MADPSGLARTAYYNNILLVRALIPTKPPDIRWRAKHWAEALNTEFATGEELATRNEYLWYLLLNLQYGDMKAPPFDKHPPPGRIRPLSTVVDAETYQKILNGIKNEIFFRDTFEKITEDKMKRTYGRFDETFTYSYGIPWNEASIAQKSKAMNNTMMSKIDDEDTKSGVSKPHGDYNPSEFLSSQPRPNLGAFCYGSVFSDYAKDDDKPQ